MYCVGEDGLDGCCEEVRIFEEEWVLFMKEEGEVLVYIELGCVGFYLREVWVDCFVECLVGCWILVY